MVLMSTERTRYRRATALALIPVLFVAAALIQGCASGRMQTATVISNDPEFAGRLNDLARNYESLNADKILPYYVSTGYDLSFETPYKVDTGATEHRATLTGLIAKMKDLHVALDPNFEAWRDGDRVWTVRGFRVTGTLKDGEKFAMSGWHSAIWDKKDDKWLIWYEHFGGKPDAAAPPAPVVVPVVVPAPTPAPAPVAKAVEIPFGDVFFDFDKWAIRANQTATLATNIDLLKKNPNVRVLIEGHCDERGGETYNFGLGDRRAEAVKKYLVAKGIEPARLPVVSYGKLKPFEQGHGEPMWGKNRRAHFVVIPD